MQATLGSAVPFEKFKLTVNPNIFLSVTSPGNPLLGVLVLLAVAKVTSIVKSLTLGLD